MPDNKHLAIMQPYFMPYIGYFQLLAKSDTFVIYDDVNFIKRGWIHRNNILVNGEANMFTIPLAKVSQNKKINDVELSPEWPTWREKFLKTIEQSYKKSPHYGAVSNLLQQIVFSETNHIATLATESIRQTAAYLKLPVKIIPSSTVYGNEELKGQERIRAICLAEQATHYTNPTGGMELYDKNFFESVGIELSFLQSTRQEYKQFNQPFVAWLSMLDVLFFNDISEVHRLLKAYELL